MHVMGRSSDDALERLIPHPANACSSVFFQGLPAGMLFKHLGSQIRTLPRRFQALQLPNLQETAAPMKHFVIDGTHYWIGSHRRLGLVIFDPAGQGVRRESVQLFVTKTRLTTVHDTDTARAEMETTPAYCQRVGLSEEAAIELFRKEVLEYITYKNCRPPTTDLPESCIAIDVYHAILGDGTTASGEEIFVENVRGEMLVLTRA